MSDAPNPNAYNLAVAIGVLMDQIEYQGGEISDEQVAYLDGLEGSFEEKVDIICELRRNDLAMEAGKRAEAKRQIANADVCRNKAERKRSDLMKLLRIRKARRIDTGLNVVRIQANSQPSVRWTGDPGAVPKRFRREIPATFELDKAAVREAWKQKEPLEAGLEVELGEHVVID